MSNISFRIKKLIILFVALFLVTQIAGSYFFYHLAIKRGPKEFLQNNADLEVAEESMDLYLKGEWLDWVNTQDFTRLTLTSRDGLELSGYYLPAKESSNKLAILTHGYLGHAKQMGIYGQFYHDEWNYNLFLPDARGHGKSEGDYYGFGWPDRLDLIDWTKSLVETLGEETEVVYHGLSMGAATVLMASGEEELPSEVKAIVADSPYKSVYQLFSYQMKRMFHLPPFPFLDSTSLLTKIRAGYGFREANSLKQVKKSTTPIFYIHGENDTFVPTEMAEELYKSTQSGKGIYLVPNANHGEAFARTGEEYKDEVKNFLSKFVQ